MSLSEMHLVLVKQPTALLNMSGWFEAQDFLSTRFYMAFDPELDMLSLRSSLRLEGSRWADQAENQLQGNEGIYSFRSTIDLKNVSLTEPFYPEETILSRVVFDEEKTLSDRDHLVMAMRDTMLMTTMTRTTRAFQDLMLSTDLNLQTPTVRLKEIYRPVRDPKSEADQKILWRDFFSMHDHETMELEKPEKAVPLCEAMTQILSRQINDRNQYLLARATYYSDDFKKDQNPFHDFLTNMQSGKKQVQSPLIPLIGTLQALSR